MWLKSLSASKLLSVYKDVKLELSDVNVFIGPNNSGKTRLLSALHSIGLSQYSSSQFTETQFGEGIVTDFASELNNMGTGFAPLRLLPVDRTPGSTIDTRNVGDRRRGGHLPHEQGGNTTGVDDLLAELHDYPLLRPLLQYEIERFFGLPLEFEIEQYNLTIRAQDSNITQQLVLSNHGRGVQYYVSLFFYLYHPKIRVLLIDEPENSLHPHLQRALLNRIRTITRERNKQVFLATHSPIFCLPNTLDDLKGIFVLRRFDARPAIFSLSNLIPNAVAERRKFESYMPNLDPGIAEVLFSKGVLVVEGQTERQFIQLIALKTKRDVGPEGLSIIETNGLSLMPGLLRILSILEIPWCALCDSDLLQNGGKRFDEYRKEMGNVLQVEVKKTENQEDFAQTRKLLESKGLFVTENPGLEHFYASEDALQYFRENSSVIPADKGWLMAEEIRHIQQKDCDYVNDTYADIFVSLDLILTEIKKTSTSPRSLKDLIKDLLFSDGEYIHRNAYRKKLTEDQVKKLLDTRMAFQEYALTFKNFKNYELYWCGPLGETYRVRCEGVWFYVEYEESKDDGYSVLRCGTVSEN